MRIDGELGGWFPVIIILIQYCIDPVMVNASLDEKIKTTSYRVEDLDLGPLIIKISIPYNKVQ